MDFDPSVIAYAELVEMVLVANGPPEGQYANLVLAHDEEQLATAREQARRLGEAGGKPPTARIELLNAVLACRGLPPEVLPPGQPHAPRTGSGHVRR